MIVRPKFFRPAEEKLPPSLTNPQELREFSDEAYEKFYEKISEAILVIFQKFTHFWQKPPPCLKYFFVKFFIGPVTKLSQLLRVCKTQGQLFFCQTEKFWPYDHRDF